MAMVLIVTIFLDVARNLRTAFPNTAFMLLDAPETIEGGEVSNDDAFQWFSLAEYDIGKSRYCQKN